MSAHDYADERKAFMARTSSLRALRLAKEAADKLLPPPVKPPTDRKPPKKKPLPPAIAR